MRSNLDISPARLPRQKRLTGSILALLVLASGFTQAGEHAATPTGGEIRPAVIYHNYCSVCHGDKGDGKSRAQNSLVPPPRNFTTPAAAQLSRERIISGIQNGRPGTAMIAWKNQLSPKEVEALADYIRDTFMPATATSGASRGRAVYAKNCAVCHGDKGQGALWAQMQPPPRNFTTPQAGAELTRQRMIASVTHGRPGTAMASFKGQLDKGDIEAAVDYIRTSFMAGGDLAGISGTHAHESRPIVSAAPAAVAAQPVSADLSLPLPNGLKGDPAKGAAFYMSNCATCHGALGDGKGPRAYFITPKPRDFLLPASRQALNRPALFNAISHGKLGTEMPAWNKVIEPLEIAHVAEFVFQKFIQPPRGKQGNASGK